MPSELNTLAALLVLAGVPLALLLLSEVTAAGVADAGVLTGVEAVVVAEELLPDEEVAVVAGVPLVFADDPPEAAGSSPSWLKAEKMLSMNPIMPLPWL